MAKDQTQFPKDDADYKLEKLVAKIQQDLAPHSKVTHNVRITGKSGAQRQIDVLVEDKVGQYDVRIVLDCKDYKHLKFPRYVIFEMRECPSVFPAVRHSRSCFPVIS